MVLFLLYYTALHLYHLKIAKMTEIAAMINERSLIMSPTLRCSTALSPKFTIRSLILHHRRA